MRRSATRVSRTIAIAVGLVISGLGATVVLAQGAPGSLQQVIALLASLQTSVNNVQTSVNTVQQGVNALGAVNNFAFTAAVIAESGIIDCTHINVTNADRHVVTQLIDASTGTVVAESSGIAATPPGRFRAIGAFVPGGFAGTGYCKFTVLDGTKADIRGNLTLTPNVGGDETTNVSVEAH